MFSFHKDINTSFQLIVYATFSFNIRYFIKFILLIDQVSYFSLAMF